MVNTFWLFQKWKYSWRSYIRYRYDGFMFDNANITAVYFLCFIRLIQHYLTAGFMRVDLLWSFITCQTNFFQLGYWTNAYGSTKWNLNVIHSLGNNFRLNPIIAPPHSPHKHTYLYIFRNNICTKCKCKMIKTGIVIDYCTF